MLYKEINIKPEITVFLLDLPEKETDLPDFNSFFSQQELIDYNQLKNVIRKQQYGLIRQFMVEVLGKKTGCISYQADGAPLLSDNEFISISHTKKIIAIALAPFAIGIDIEHPASRLEKVVTRFLNNKELALKEKFSLTELSFLWNLKEATLKQQRKKTIDYQNHIIIEQCDFKNQALVYVRKEGELKKLKSHLINLSHSTLAIVY
ncbi:MAG: 4'-phosphopantetheinyl transferase superfamily protein [Bacteroidia bacterium]|nr:4'-phosphopantetheinyl transferase superfamily protein [Bacteroidia bacterium]